MQAASAPPTSAEMPSSWAKENPTLGGLFMNSLTIVLWVHKEHPDKINGDFSLHGGYSGKKLEGVHIFPFV